VKVLDKKKKKERKKEKGLRTLNPAANL